MTDLERDARLERERAFHDDRFTNDDERAAAGKYYSVTRASASRFQALVDRIPTGGHVLEVGCGLEGVAVGLAGRGVSVTAIDISPVAVEQLRSHVSSLALDALVDLEVMDAEQLEFDPGSFDLVVGTGILHHLDLKRVFPEIARVLRPDGRGVFMEPLGRNPVINLYRRLTPRMRTPDEHPLVPADFDLAGRTFGLVDVTYHHLLSLLSVPARRWSRFPALLDRLDAADEWLFTRVPLSRALAWTCVIELGQPLKRTPGAG